MLVRSASTPILGALHASAAGNHSPAVSCSSPLVHFPESSPTVAHHAPAVSCHLSGDAHDRSTAGGRGMRRTRSDGNLSTLAGRADDHHHLLPPSGRPAAPRPRPALETIVSFTAREGKPDSTEDDEEEDDDEGFDQEMSFGQFALGGGGGGSTFQQEHPLFLARGLGIDRLGSGLLGADGFGGFDGDGGGGGGGCLLTYGNGGDRSGIETHYKKLIEDDPSNGLYLRNYAQFLYQVKGDQRRAEEYYSRAILADSNDGELLSEYAKLVWDVHRDEERASSYFEQAAKASPHNSHVLAAQAAFLWDTDDGAGPEESYAAGFAAARKSLASAMS